MTVSLATLYDFSLIALAYAVGALLTLAIVAAAGGNRRELIGFSIIWPVGLSIVLVILAIQAARRYSRRFPSWFAWRPGWFGYSGKQRNEMVVGLEQEFEETYITLGGKRLSPTSKIPGLNYEEHAVLWTGRDYDWVRQNAAIFALANRLPTTYELVLDVEKLQIQEARRRSETRTEYEPFYPLAVFLFMGAWIAEAALLYAEVLVHDTYPTGISVPLGFTLGMLSQNIKFPVRVVPRRTWDEEMETELRDRLAQRGIPTRARYHAFGNLKTVIVDPEKGTPGGGWKEADEARRAHDEHNRRVMQESRNRKRAKSA